MRSESLGKEGEALARKFLAEKGYTILDQNWRYMKYELDLVCTDQQELVVVEVKTRETGMFGEPWTFLTLGQQKNIIKAADAYVQQKRLDLEVRFDVVSIILNQHRTDIEHLQEAFYPML